MPTFGNTNIETSVSNLDDTIIAGRFTMGAVAGQADKLTCYMDSAVFLGGTSHPVRGAIYTDVADPVLVGMTDEVSINEDTFADSWVDLPFSVKPSLAASTSYLLAAWADNFSGTMRSRRAASGGAGIVFQSLDYSTASGVFPDPLSETTLDADGLMSIYCTYTESTGARMLASTGVGT